MIVDEKLISTLADLSRLELSGQEKEDMKSDLEQIIAFVDKLNELDTTNVKPAIFMGENINIYRETGEVGQMLPTKEALQPANTHSNQFFMVPKVIKRD